MVKVMKGNKYKQMKDISTNAVDCNTLYLHFNCCKENPGGCHKFSSTELKHGSKMYKMHIIKGAANKMTKIQ